MFVSVCFFIFGIYTLILTLQFKMLVIVLHAFHDFIHLLAVSISVYGNL